MTSSFSLTLRCLAEILGDANLFMEASCYALDTICLLATQLFSRDALTNAAEP